MPWITALFWSCFITLIAVILFAALMFVISKSTHQDNSADDLATGQTRVMTTEILAYAASVNNAIVQMQQSGATPDQIDFMLPDDTNFNTAPTLYKLFHPDGGGLNYKPLPARAVADSGGTPQAGYYVGRFNSVEWTPTTAHDIVFTAYKLSESVCKDINRKLTGSATIPVVSGESLENLFVWDHLHSGTNANFMVTQCAACEDVAALCVGDGAGKYAFYSIFNYFQNYY